jgi:hypothetical protein
VNHSPTPPIDLIEPQIAELLGRLSTVICVFLDWTESRRDFALRLRSEGVAVKAIVCRDGACTLAPTEDAPFFGEIPVISDADFARGLSQL